MTVGESLHALLSTTAGLTALVGTRIYPGGLPLNSLRPALVYQRISGERVSSLSGPSGLARPRYQIDVYADSYASAQAVAEVIRETLDGYRDTPTGSDLMLEGVALENDFDEYEPATKLYRVSADYFIWHRE